MPQYLVFDAYGTLFHFRPPAEYGALKTFQHAFQQTRSKQLEYSRLLALMGRYRPFDDVTQMAFTELIRKEPGYARFKAPLLQTLRAPIVAAEVPQQLATLQAAGYQLAILSNGTPTALRRLVTAHQLSPFFSQLFSADAAQTFKPSPAVYRLVTEAYGCTPGEVRFVSSNQWDVAGAAAYGFRCAWLNRSDDAADVLLDGVSFETIRNLDELLTLGS